MAGSYQGKGNQIGCSFSRAFQFSFPAYPTSKFGLHPWKPYLSFTHPTRAPSQKKGHTPCAFSATRQAPDAGIKNYVRHWYRRSLLVSKESGAWIMRMAVVGCLNATFKRPSENKACQMTPSAPLPTNPEAPGTTFQKTSLGRSWTQVEHLKTCLRRSTKHM